MRRIFVLTSTTISSNSRLHVALRDQFYATADELRALLHVGDLSPSGARGKLLEAPHNRVVSATWDHIYSGENDGKKLISRCIDAALGETNVTPESGPEPVQTENAKVVPLAVAVSAAS